jgi:membrane protease YdiL (CAAX protease family)
MRSNLNIGDKHYLRWFFLIAFAWTWLLNLPRILAAGGWFSLPGWLSAGLGYVAVFGPSLAAFGLTAIESGKEGVRSLWRRGWEMNFRKTWLISTILLVPLCGLITLGCLTALGGSIPWQLALQPGMLVPAGLLIWLLGALPEEYGWRGYALDRMQKYTNPLIASLVLGLMWSLWHLPLHFIPGTTQAVIPVWEFTCQMVLLSILYTWLHNHTGGSVLVAAAFHASSNLTGAVIPTWTTSLGRWLGLLPLLFVAITIVLRKALNSPACITPSGEASSPTKEVNLEWR